MDSNKKPESQKRSVNNPEMRRKSINKTVSLFLKILKKPIFMIQRQKPKKYNRTRIILEAKSPLMETFPIDF